MKRTFKRAISLLLALVLVFTMLPLNVFATYIIDDAVTDEIPVADEADNNSGALGGEVSDEEEPETPPVLPTDPPGEDMAIIDAIEISLDSAGNPIGHVQMSNLPSVGPGISVAVVILPDFSYEFFYDGSWLTKNNVAGEIGKDAYAPIAIESITTGASPFILMRAEKVWDGSSSKSLTIGTDAGQLQFVDNPSTTDDVTAITGDIVANMHDTIYGKDNHKVKEGSYLKYRILAQDTTGAVNSKAIEIPATATLPDLTLSISPPTVTVGRSMPSDTTFSQAIIKNNSAQTLTEVSIGFAAKKLGAVDTGYGSTPVAESDTLAELGIAPEKFDAILPGESKTIEIKKMAALTTNNYYNFTLRAVAKEGASAQATGGVFNASASSYTPVVNLVDKDGIALKEAHDVVFSGGTTTTISSGSGVYTGGGVSTGQPCSVTVDGIDIGTMVSASNNNIKITMYKLADTVIPNAAGVTSKTLGGASFAKEYVIANATVALSTSATGPMTFKNWTGDLTGSSASTTILMNSDKTIVANYEGATFPAKLIVSVNGTASDVNVNSIEIKDSKDNVVASMTSGLTKGSDAGLWTMSLAEGDSYTVHVNGFPALDGAGGATKTITKDSADQTVNLGQVAKSVMGGAVGYITIPDDGKAHTPGRTGDNFFYPEHTEITVTSVPGTDTLDKLIYDNGDIMVPKTLIAGGVRKTLQATFISRFKGTVTVRAENALYTGNLESIYVVENTDIGKTKLKLEQNATTKSNYEIEGLTTGLTYSIYVNGFDTDIDITDTSTKTIRLHTVTMSDAPETAATASTFSGGSYAAVTTGLIPGGKTITITAGTVTGKNFEQWAVAGNLDGTLTSATASPTTYTVTATNNSTDVTTITASYNTSAFSGDVVVTWDGTTPGGKTAEVIIKEAGETAEIGKSTTDTNGKVTFPNLNPAKTYDVYINGVKHTGTDSQLTDTNQTVTASLVSAIGKTNGNGTVAISATGYTTETTGSTANSEKTLWVLSGTSVTWTATPATGGNFEFKEWVGGATTNPITVSDLTTSTTNTATFELLKKDITVNFKKDTAATNHTLPAGTVVKLDNGTNTLSFTLTADGTSAVIADVPYSTSPYTVYINDVATAHSIIVNASKATVDVMYYSLTLATPTNGYVDFATAAPTANGTTLTKVELPNTEVNIAAGPATNYAFTNWTGGTDASFDTGVNTTAVTTYKVTKTETLTANFQKDKYTATLDLQFLDVAVAALGADITAINLVGTAPASTAAGSYDATTQTWQVENLPNANTYKWVVTTTSGDYEVAGVTSAAADKTMKLYSVSVVDGVGNTTNKPYLNAAGTTRFILPSDANVSINANPDTGYTLGEWKKSDAAALPAGVTIANGTLTLAAAYTATANLELKPIYTFTATITTTKDGTLTDVTQVELKNGGDITKAVKATADGTYQASALDPAKEYAIWVNGFDTGEKTKTPTTVPITLRAVTVDKTPASSNGTAYIAGVTPVTGTATTYLVPNGATGSLYVLAAAGTTHRLADTVWTTTASALAITTATDATTAITVTNLTADATVTANFVLQYDAAVSVTGAGTPGSTATFTAAGSTGTVIASDKLSAKVDTGTYVEATFVKATGEMLTGWTVTNGKLYSDAGLTTEITNPTTDKTETVYFVPNAAGATLVAEVGAGKYPAEITVNLDNGAKPAYTVELWKDGAKVYDATDADNNGTYTVDALVGSYNIYTNAAGTLADTGETVTVAVTTGGSATVNYYTVKLAAAPVDTTTSYVGFAASPAATTATKVFLYTTNPLNIYATAETTPKHFRFDAWASANGGTFGTTVANTTYTMPALGILQGDASIATGNGITLTATFKEQFKVTLKEDSATASWGTITKPHASAVAEGDGWTLLVDKGATLTLTNTVVTAMKVLGWVNTTGTANYYDSYTDDTTNTPAGTTIESGTTYSHGTTNNKVVILKPDTDVTATVTYTKDAFAGTIKLLYNGAAYNEGGTQTNIDVYDSANKKVASRTDSTAGLSSITAIAGKTGEYTVPGLTNGEEYTVFVNGYTTGKILNNTTPSSTNVAEVTLHKIALDVYVDGAASTSSTGHTATSNTTFAPYISAQNRDMYLPDTAAVNIVLKSADGIGFRRNTAADTPNDQLVIVTGGGAIAAANPGATATNYTHTLTADVTLRANFTSVFALTTTAGAGGTATPTTATVDQGKSGTVVAAPTTSTAMNANAFANWDIATTPAGAGTWWTSATDSTEDTAGPRTATDFFGPTANTTLHATFKNLQATGITTPPAGVSWNATTGATVTVKAGYTATTAVVDLKNAASAATAALSTTLAAGAIDGDATAFGTPTLASTAALAVNGTTTVSIPVATGKGIGTYTAVVTVTDAAGLTITIPVTLKVEAPATFTAVVDTFPDGAAAASPVGSVVLVEKDGTTNVTTTDTNGSYTFTGLAWDKSYNVYVNGYLTTTVVTNANVATAAHWDVKDLYTLSFKDSAYLGGAPTITTNPDAKVQGVPATVVKPTAAPPAVASIILPGGASVTVAAVPSTATPYYRLNKWQHVIASNGDADATLTANTYTVGTATDATNSNSPIKLNPLYIKQFKIDMTTKTGLPSGNPTAKPALPTGITAASTVYVDEGSLVDMAATIPIGYAFKEWTASNAAGTFDASATAGDTGTVLAGSYTPAADTTITLDMWQDATLTGGGWSYDIGAGFSGTNPAATLTWMEKDAANVAISYKETTAGTYATLEPVNYTVTNGVYTLTPAFLKTLAVAGYTVQFAYDLGTNGHANQVPDQTLTQTFTITATAAALTQVTVQEDTGKTSVATGGTVKYKEHTPVAILPGNLLTYQWYYADTAPTQAVGTTLPAGATAIGSAETTGSVTVPAAAAGKYVFAVVTATVTGTGSVVTNGVPVDYTATVNVTLDGSAAITAADHSIVFRPAGATDATSDITATWSVGNSYTAPLVGGVVYKVMAYQVQGNTTGGTALLVDTTQTVQGTAATATVPYYTVNHTALTQTHATDRDNVEVGESFTSPTVTVTAGTSNAPVADGKAVLSGTTVTAKSAAWTADYTLEWYKGATTADTASGVKQGSTLASTTGYTPAAITAKTYLGGKLAQNTYTISGDIKTSTLGLVTAATLTSGTHVFNSTSIFTPPGWSNGVIVSFTVPKSGVGSLTNHYTIQATAHESSTISGYSVPAASAANGLSVLEPVTADGTGKFTIFLAADNSNVVGPDGEPEEIIPGGKKYTDTFTKYFADYIETNKLISFNNKGNVNLDATLVIKKTVGSTTTIIFDATTDELDAELVKFTGVPTAGEFPLTAEGTTNAKEEVTLTVPADLNWNSDVTYTLEVTTHKTGYPAKVGPTIIYDYIITISPDEVTAVTTKAGTTLGTVEHDSTTFTPNIADKTKLVDGTDLIYQWYLADYGTTPTIAADGAVTGATAATGAGNNTRTYTIATADAGKQLHLAVTGKNNAAKAAISPATLVPYQGKVKVVAADGTTNLGGADYVVYLVPGTDAFAMATAIPTTYNGATEFYETAAGALTPGVTYHAYSNLVEGTYTADGHFKDTTKTITAVTSDAIIKYMAVTYDDHATIKNAYAGMDETGIIASTNDTYKITAKTDITDLAVENDKHVLDGTKVNFSIGPWATYDYKLNWDGAVGKSTVPATGNAIASIKGHIYTTDAARVVGELEQMTYDVVAWAVGTGALSKITMTQGANIFTTVATDAVANTFNAVGGVKASVNSGTTVTFKVPLGSYTAEGTAATGATTRKGYRVPHSDTTLLDTPTATVSTINGSFDVVLESTGQSMNLADDQTPAVTGGASFDGAVHNGTAKRTITLPYGYAAKSVVVTVTNASSTDQSLYNVTMTPAATGNTDKVTLSANGFDGTPDLTKAATETVTLNIDTGLTVGTHNYLADFSFDNADAAAVGTPKITYTLEIVVEPIALTAVTTDKDRTLVKHDTPITYTVHTTDQAGVTLPLTDFTYTWVSGTTVGTAPTVSWNTTTGDMTISDGTAITNATLNSFTPDATYAGKQVYLAISAIKGSSGTGAVISDPITVGYQPVVQVKVDGTQYTQTADPGYTVKITQDGTDYTTKWDDTADGYILTDANATLDPRESAATVTVSRMKGDSTNLVTLTGAALTATAPTATAEYFTVTTTNLTATDAVEYQTGTGEVFASTYPTLTAQITTGGAAADVGTSPVLKGQSVTTKSNTWTQDYDFTWREKIGNAAMADTTTKQDSAAASATGYAKVIADTTTITGRLNQNTYEVTATIVGTGTVTGITMEGGRTVNTYFAGTSVPGAIGNGNSLVGALGTFKLPMGSYNIEATGNALTTISNITVGAAVTPGNKGTIDLKDHKAYTINLDTASVQLTVTDDNSPPNTATSIAGNAATNDQKVTYTRTELFNAVDNASWNLTLANPGNADLTVNLEILKNGASVYNTAVGASDTYIDTGVLTVSAIMAKDLSLAASATAAAAATLTLDAAAAANADAVYTFKFTSASDKGAPIVSYVLDLTVNPLPITGATIENAGKTTAPAVGDTLQLTGNAISAITVFDTTTTADTKGLVDGDFAYQWVSVLSGATKPAITLNDDGTLKIPAGVTTLTDAKQHIVTTADAGRDLYLVVYAASATANASGITITDALATQYTAKILVELDEGAQPTTGTADPGYTIKVGEDLATATAATWDATAKAYTVSLDPAKTYKIFAATTKGGTDGVDTTLTFAPTDKANKTVDYYSVNFDADVARINTHATGILASTTVETMSAAAGATDLPHSTPVLKGTNVVFTIADTAETNADKRAQYTPAWTNATASGTPLVSTALQYNAVKNEVSAVLNQKLYDVDFVIKGVGTITAATAVSTDHTGDDAGKFNPIIDIDGGTVGKHITFKVPAGSFDLTVTPEQGTTVKEYIVNAGTATTDKATLANVRADATNNNSVELEASTYTVEWQDDFAAKDTFVPSAGFSKDTGLVYGSYTAQTHTVRLVNTGNAAITGLTLEYTGTDLEVDLAGGQIGTTPTDLTAAFTLPVGTYAQFDITIPVGKSAATYAADTVAVAGVTHNAYTTSYTVSKAPITLLDVDGITAPVVGATPDATSVTLTGVAPASSVTKVGGVVWTGALDSDKFAPGRAYTATVTYQANANFVFDAAYIADLNVTSTTGYTIMDGKNSDTTTTVTYDATAGTLTLAYTFPATAPALTLDAKAGTAKRTGIIDSFTVTSDGAVDIYYLVMESAASAPTAAQILSGAAIAGSVMAGSVKNVTTTHTDNIAITGLNADGAQFTVYAVAVPKDAVVADPYAGAISTTAEDTLKTHYRVKVEVAASNSGEGHTITNPAHDATENAHVTYVSAEAVPAATTTVTVNVNASAGKAFSAWTSTAGGNFADATLTTAVFTPTDNTTLTANFDGVPRLTLAGTPRTNEVSKNYEAGQQLLQNGITKNPGTKVLDGDATLIVTYKNYPGTSTPITAEMLTAALREAAAGDNTELQKITSPYFKSSMGNPTGDNYQFAAGASAPVSVNPGTVDGRPLQAPSDTDNRLSLANAKKGTYHDVAVNDDNGYEVGVYLSTLWVYDAGVIADATTYPVGDANRIDKIDLDLRVVDNGFIATSLNDKWDINPMDPLTPKNNTDWVMNVNDLNVWKAPALKIVAVKENGVVTTLDKTLTLGTDYTYGKTAVSGTLYTHDLSLSVAQLRELLETYPAMKSGDYVKLAFSLTTTDTGGENIIKPMTLTYIDTTPGVTITLPHTGNNATAGKGQKLTATVAVANNGGYIASTPTYNVVDNSTFPGVPPADAGPISRDVEVVWYSLPSSFGGTITDEASLIAAGATVVQAATHTTSAGALEYTVKETDSGRNLYAAIKGNGYNYRGANISGPVYIAPAITLAALRNGTTVVTGGITGTLSDGITAATSPYKIVMKYADGILNLTATAPAGYLFTGWTGKNVADADVGTFDPVSVANRTATYTAAGEATVTGWYDLLPTVTPDRSYDIYNPTILPAFTYTQNDASGALSIQIVPQTGFTFKDGTTDAKTLAVGIDITAVTGVYTLTKAWIDANLKLDGLTESKYTITFLDTTKGATANPAGNALYDPTVTLTVKAAADFTVTADATAEVYYGNKDLEATPDTITATPKAVGQTFAYTAVDLTDGTQKLALKNYMTAAGMTGAQADAAIAKAMTAPAWLTMTDTTTGSATFSVTGEAKGVNVAKTGTTDNTDEVIVYVAVTEKNSGLTKYVPYTVDVKTTPLAITTPISAADYVTAYLAGESVTKIEHGMTVEKKYFTFDNVVSGKNPDDKVVTAPVNAGTDPAAGTWTVTPTTFDGTGDQPINSKNYTFTFTYKPATDEQYNYEMTQAVLSIGTAKPSVGITFADVRTGAVLPGGNDAAMGPAAVLERLNDKITYKDATPSYQVTLKNPNATLTGVKMVLVGNTNFDMTTTNLGTIKTYNPATGMVGTGTMATDDTLVFTLTPKAPLSVGTYTVEYKATGTSALGVDTQATYKITFVIEQKVIEDPQVTIPDPELGKNFPTKDEVVVKDKDGNRVDDVTDVEVKWEEKVPGKPGDPEIWKPVEGTQPQPGKEYRPVVVVKPDGNHKLDDTIDNEKINGDKDKENDAEISKDGTNDKFVGGATGFPVLMFEDQKAGGADKQGPKVNLERNISIKVGAAKLGSYEIFLGDWGEDINDVKMEYIHTLAKFLDRKPETLGNMSVGQKEKFILDLSSIKTDAAFNESLLIRATGKDKNTGGSIVATYKINVLISPTGGGGGGSTGGGGGGGSVACPHQVFYWLGITGTTLDSTVEHVANKGNASKVPLVIALPGYTFAGWTTTKPEAGKESTLVDPTTVTITGDTTFYAVYKKTGETPDTTFHEHFVIGYPNGNFGPADNINRASVATIIARAILPGFVEGSDYGNPGGYGDVAGHWAESAIAYTSKYGVFEGYDDGNFYPDTPITRQEFALAIARLDGVMKGQDMPFSDIADAGDWALDGIYTAYANGWVNGYQDGTFKPLSDIRRDEAVKLLNAYLNRGVDAAGLASLKEYIHSGVASNNTENGTTEYMTWPDVPKSHWAYYEIIEAANDHEFFYTGEKNDKLPEQWIKSWIDERWRYNDDINDGGSK